MANFRRFTPGRIAAFIILVALFFAWQGHDKIPKGPASGDKLNGEFATTEPAGNTLRVATFNIDGGVGKADGQLDLDRTASAIKGFDIIGLQEVHGGTPLIGGADQTEILGNKLSMPWVFAPVESQWFRDSFGDGMLTNLPVEHWQQFPLANAVSNSNRELLILQVQFHGRTVTILNTHLERHDDRDAELKTCIEMFKSMQEPVILMGDLNTPKDDPQIKALRATAGVADPIGAALNDKMNDTIDWIFARGLHATQGGFADNGASDHPVVWAEFTLP